MVLSADSENDPDMIGITGASAAAFISDLPFTTPVAAVRVGLVEGKLVANPTVAEQKTSLLNIVVVATEQAIVMIEAGAIEVSEDSVADALQFGHDQIKRIIAAIRELHDKVKPNKVTVPPLPFDEALAKEIEQKYGARLHDALDTAKYPKKESYHLIDDVKKAILESIPEEDEEKRALAVRAFERLREHYFREDILERHRRPDARAFDEDSRNYLRSGSTACARTARRYSRAARRKRWRPPRWAPRKTSSASTCSSRKNRSSASCCTTTSRRFPSAK